MTKSFAELLGDEEPADEGEGRKRRFRRLRSGLSSSRNAIARGLTGWRYNPDDLDAWEGLEDILISADCGLPTTQEIVERLEKARPKTSEDVLSGLQTIVAELASPAGEPRLAVDASPAVFLVVGVNGTGKTTSIGKLASRLTESGRSVVVAAADTYRAAAGEQLEVWAERAGADFVGSTRGGDPGAVAYDAIDAAVARGRDVVLVDTAGRLHTQTDLMDELAKVRRVITTRLEGAPHETLLTMDATTGQNGLRQAALFQEVVEVSGVVLTKLDGTAKGGIVLAIGQELDLPVKLVGVGEGIDDLQPFRRPRLRAGAAGQRRRELAARGRVRDEAQAELNAPSARVTGREQHERARPCAGGDAPRRQVRDELHDAQVAVEEDDVDGIARKQRVRPAGRLRQQATAQLLGSGALERASQPRERRQRHLASLADHAAACRGEANGRERLGGHEAVIGGWTRGVSPTAHRPVAAASVRWLQALAGYTGADVRLALRQA